ncbi:hypothetical protein HYV83_01520 [Candidatus Woesearchaeota archaeon]|nr:hypothetical protein [Candidatus Woesearchaeota archaeon]
MAKGITLVIPQRTVVYASVALVVAVIVILNIYAFFISGREGSNGKGIENTAENFASAKAAENQNDKCATPSGYTDEQWKEHMGHHPDQYAECL